MLRYVAAIIMANILFLESGAGQENKAKVIADMEKKPNYTAKGTSAEPKVSLNSVTIAQGAKSLRFEYDAQAGDEATLEFPVDGAQGFNALAFDLYAEHANEGTLGVSINQVSKDKKAAFTAAIELDGFIDKFEPVCLIENVRLKFTPEGDLKPDWSAIKSVSFVLSCKKKGKFVYYLDNIRFLSVSGDAQTANMLKNSSFEMATNPDIPDYWGRDLATPPHGEDVWAIDPGTAYHGKKSIRIGVKDKYARSKTQIAKGEDYTFSVYLKSSKDDTKVRLQFTGVERKTGKNEVIVGKDWQRYSVTAKTTGSETWASVCLLSDAVLWLDAAQLEQGQTPRPYALSPLDVMESGGTVQNKQAPSHPNGKHIELLAKRATLPPALDGKLDDPCWQEAAEMSQFIKISDKNEPAKEQTKVRFCYDDKALYFAVRAEQSDMKAVSAILAKARPGPWDTDLVEFFIDLSHDRRTYYHFAVDARGEKWQKQKNPAKGASNWYCEWQAKGATDASGWTAEIAIPYTCFELQSLTGMGDVIGLNVCRTSNPEPLKKERREYSSWSFSPGGFEVPSAFGAIRGIKMDFTPYRFEAASLDWYNDIARACIKNQTGKDQSIKVSFCLKDSEGNLHQATAGGQSKTGAELELSASLPLQKPGLYTMFARVTDETGCERLFSHAVNVRISGAQTFDFVGTEFDFYTNETEARARCFVGAGAERCKDLKLYWWIESGEQKVDKQQAPVELKPGINTWTVPVEKLAKGTYLLKVALHEKDKQIAEAGKMFRKLPPAGHEVRINQWGRFLVCDGKPFFWYGFYTSEIAETNQVAIDILKDMKSVNSTAVLNYVSYNQTGYKNLGWALDRANELGMKMWVHLHRMVAYCSPKNPWGDEQAAIAEMTDIIAKYKNHPALLGWCTLDEPGNRPTLFTKEYTEKWYRRIKELDPYHPCIFSHLCSPEETEIYGKATDLALIPFGGDNRAEQLFQAFWDIGLPMAVNPPCYDGGITVRAPTPSEQRTRMYRALILGACGLCTYTYRCNTMHTWREFARVGKELEFLAPIILTPDDRLRVDVSPRGKDIFARLKKYQDKYYLLAVNMGSEQVEAAFRLNDASNLSALKPMFDSPAARLDPEAKKITVSMKPESTGVYEIGACE